MTGRTRLLAGWALTLAAALLLNLLLRGDTTVPPPAVAGPAVPSPTAAPTPTAPAPIATPEATTLASPAPTPGPLAAEEASALAAATDRARVAFDLDALVIGVSIDGLHEWSGGSGHAADGVTPLAGGDPFVIGSVSKTFTATIVMQLADEGRLELDDPVTRYLPDEGVASGVSIEQLLDHTSGIPDLLVPLRAAMNANLGRRFTPAEVVAQVGDPEFVAGTDWAYSNTNYVLLGMLIEAATGRRFVDELRDRVLEPLGLAETGMLLEPGAPALLPPSWASVYWTSGAMYSTADDLLHWGDALYTGGVLSPESLARMLTFNADDYGLGAQRLTLRADATGYGHSGLLKGFISMLVHLPEQHVTIVMLATNTQEFDPARLLAHTDPGEPSILDLALADATG